MTRSKSPQPISEDEYLPGYRLNSVAVFAPHPDDEAIGCGGTIRRHVEHGDAVHTIFLTSGENGGHGKLPEETRATRECEAERAAKMLGTHAPDFLRLPDGEVRPHSRTADHLANWLVERSVQAVYVTHGSEGHSDHRAAFALARKAAAIVETRTGSAPAIWCYEVWTPMQEFDFVVDISEQLPVKLAAVRAHASQCKVMRFDQACRGLARYRGEMHCWPGGDYAEVFAEAKPLHPKSRVLHGTRQGGKLP